MSARHGAESWALLVPLLAVLADAAAASETVGGRFETVGAGRCSATACHGSPEPVAGSRVLRDEHTTWAARDPHADAYQVLHTAWSRSIAAKLGRGGTAVLPAHRDGRCLACHATPGPERDAALAAVVRQDGVGCESCHGPAGSWLAPHNTYEWDGLSPREKEERFGMVPVEDLSRRAETCVRCHVGEAGRPGREVDHDLIAAGHPRLAFEFAAFLANMPAHWVERDRNAAADFPARTWAIGQAVASRAALELLGERARAAAVAREGEPRRWPEFAEYDCASCHQELRPRPPASAVGSVATRTGLPAWGTWWSPMIATLADLDDDPDAKAFRSSLGNLTLSMGEAVPAPGAVADEAGETTAALSRWLRTLQQEAFDPPRVEGLVGPLRSWDAARQAAGGRGLDLQTQEYLALVALRQALSGPARDRGGFLAELRSRQGRLKAPFNAERPGAFGPSR